MTHYLPSRESLNQFINITARHRVLRGGQWRNTGESRLRVAHRHRIEMDEPKYYSGFDVGFRVARLYDARG
jgi:formylglycine-generating enzyme required for sulfatase activity